MRIRIPVLGPVAALALALVLAAPPGGARAEEASAPSVAQSVAQSVASAPAAAAAPATPASVGGDAPHAADESMIDTSHARFKIRPVDDAWRAALPHDADAATQAYLDRLPADVVARSNSYFEGGYWLILWDFLIGLAIAAILLGGKRSARLRDWAYRVGRRPVLGDALYAGVYWVATWTLALPMTIYEGFVREHQYAMATQTFGPWFGEQLIGLAVAVVASMIIVPLLYAGIRRAGDRWWQFATGFATVFVVLSLLLVPTFIEPLFNTYKPVQDPTIKSQVLAMAHANGVPADNVYEFDASRQTTRVSANVTGILGTASVRLNDNLLHRSSLSEIRAVMGHELGHYVMNHIYKSLFELTVVLFFLFALTAWGLRRAMARWGAGWGLRGIGDVAALPLLSAVFSVFMLLATPINNTLTRTQEIEADRFGLNLSREPLGEAEVDLKLTEYRKPDPGPIEEFVFFDHPSTRFRVHDAMRWREAMKADGPGKEWAH
jgi:STE24 endopeptidase